MARHAKPDRHAIEPLELPKRLRAVALVVLATAVVGSATGLVLGDDAPSAEFAPRPLATADAGLPLAAKTPANDARPPRLPPLIAIPEPSSDPAIPALPVEPNWAAVLGRLDADRSRAFGLGDVALLSTVYVDRSRPIERDSAALLALATAGVRAVGLRLVVDDVTLADTAGEQVVLRVVDHIPAYDLLRGDGSVAEHRAGRGTAVWLVTITGAGDAWKIAAISEA